MARKAKGTAPGRSSAFSGEKLAFLLSFENDFRTMDRGLFYDDVTKQWCTRYGYDLPVVDNVDGSVDAWVPVNRKEGLTGDALKEENDFQDKYRKDLRMKLSSWFRHRFTGKRLHGGALKAILQRMQLMSSTAARPRRKPNLAVYSGLYYATKLKAGFDAQWKEARKTLPKSERIHLCQAYVEKCWEEETEEFRETLAREADEDHVAAVKKFKERHNVEERTAESYHNALQTFDEVGIPLADALSEHLGMHIVIMAVGPVGEQKGEVRLRTIFSDTSSGATSKIWGQFDRAAFTAAEASITRYGRAFFTKDQCRDRIWPPPEAGETGGADLSTLLRMDESVDEPVAPVQPEPEDSTVPSPPTQAGAGGAAGLAAGAGVAVGPAASDGAPPVPPLCPPTSSARTSGPAAGEGEAPVPPPRPPTPPARPPTASMRSPTPPVPQIDQYGWTKTQTDVYTLMMEKQWGPRFSHLIDAVVAFEESQLWREGDLPRSNVRPEEIAQWMKEHRKGGDYNKLKPAFGERVVAWWRSINPAFRERDDLIGEPWPLEPKSGWTWSDWCGLRESGNNGILLVVQALTWWGQSIVNEASGDGLGAGENALSANTLWQTLLEDVIYALESMMDESKAADSIREELAAERELARAERLRGGSGSTESSGKKAKKGAAAKKDPKRATAKTATAKTAKAAVKPKAPAKPNPPKKRKRAADTDNGEGSTVEAEGSGVKERPKPRPLKRARPLDKESPAIEEPASSGANVDGANLATNDSAVNGPLTQSAVSGSGGTNSSGTPAIAVASSNADATTVPSAMGEDVQMPPPEKEAKEAQKRMEQSHPQDIDDDDDDPFAAGAGDPFGADDSTAGMTAEERLDFENEMALDSDADKDSDDDEDEDEDEDENNAEGATKT